VVTDLDISADDLVRVLLNTGDFPRAAILDSCGVGHLGSHLLIAGAVPDEVVEIKNAGVEHTLRALEDAAASERAAIFTLSYDFGAEMLGLTSHRDPSEPDLYLATYKSLFVHDYTSGKTSVIGEKAALPASIGHAARQPRELATVIESNFSTEEYLAAIETIKELIRSGYTYQTNLTRKVTATLPVGLDPDEIFLRLRRDHPAPFAAFIRRSETTAISASPERFFRMRGRCISTSPIKGTRRRGRSASEDGDIRRELLASEKDRAENIMIVDLLRNDLGRVCEYGSVEVEKLCELEEHPTLFHLVSTIRGRLRPDVKLSDVLRSLFPCGSITGAPKISTMKIINEVERSPRGLSMGSLGYYIPQSMCGELAGLDMSVAIRTIVVQGRTATFNVGGGIVIDSVPAAEWDETETKARALLAALGVPGGWHL
jgi:para-aminobenzoate synthetase component I